MAGNEAGSGAPCRGVGAIFGWGRPWDQRCQRRRKESVEEWRGLALEVWGSAGGVARDRDVLVPWFLGQFRMRSRYRYVSSC